MRGGELLREQNKERLQKHDGQAHLLGRVCEPVVHGLDALVVGAQEFEGLWHRGHGRGCRLDL